MSKKFVIQSHRSRRWGIVSSVALLLLLLWILLSGGETPYLEKVFGDNLHYMQLWHANRHLEREKRQLQREVMRLQETVAIDQQAARNAQGEIKKLQEDIHRLNSELEFYHDIMDEASAVKGLNAGIYIEPLWRQAAGYRLKLVLSHVGKGNRVLRGVAEVTLEGTRHGAEQVVNLRDISLDKKLDLRYKFRHFQRFESSFLLPERFEPQRVAVNLLSRNKKNSRLRKMFDWSESSIEKR